MERLGHLKTAFVEALPTLTGLATGYNPGRSVAGETAAILAPKGRVERSENIARNAAVIGAPLGGLVAMGLARRHNLAPRLKNIVSDRFPGGLIAEPSVEQELVNLGVPSASAIVGSLAGGAASGAAVGGLQRLRGPIQNDRDKVASLRPSPMWSRIGGANASRPLWMRQAGFTPTGFRTPAQRLSKSMDMGKVDGSAGLKPLDVGKLQQSMNAQSMGKTAAEEEQTEQHNGRRAAAGIALELAGTGGMASAARGMLNNQQREGALAGSEELLSKVKGQADVPVHAVKGLGNALYFPRNDGGVGLTQFHQQAGIVGSNPRAPHVMIDDAFKAPSLLSHELAHSEIDKTRLGRLIQRPGYNRFIGGAGRPLAAMGVGLATGGFEDERVRNAGLVGAGLLAAPNLASEGLANIKGYQRLSRLGASPAQLSAARRTLASGMGSYLGQTAATVGTAMLGSGIAGAVGNSVRGENDSTKVGEALAYITKAALAQDVQERHEREDEETGDEREPELGKTADDGGHGGFSTNQYSGVMNPPAMVYASGIPGWREPPVKTAGPPPEKEKAAVAGLTPLSRLNSSRMIGAPRATPAPGPSIAQISKPKGYGTPMSGAKKGNNII